VSLAGAADAAGTISKSYVAGTGSGHFMETGGPFT
jgi:hypothetical protein